ncbi:hypothetical protein WJX72_007649 [[Myrmecia] bisecta]|uniref:Lipoyl-binding domain-containing protein n=1 Tax=[Myrmecia] bisecta TaxID=41462 RepID=A0AAW1PSN6_9CHLO
MEMSPDALKSICKEHKLYTTPSLNDKLYCNFKGFHTIANLEAYTGLKALFLEGNALDTLHGLPKLSELKCLFVQQNILSDLEGLENAQNLNTLNVSNNNLTKLDNLSCCPDLETLLCAHNRLASYDSVSHLADCKSLTTLDLQDNKLDDPDIMEIFKQLPNLRCLYLRGNEVVSMIKNYRKTLIAAIPTLTYLDDRPVFELERRCAEAWMRGGLDAEREERVKFKSEEQQRERRNFEYLQNLRKEGFRKRREALGLPPGDTDPYFDDMSDGEWEPEEEPTELVAARDRLAAFTARENEEEPAELTKARRDLVASGGKVAEGNWSPLQPLSAARGNIQPTSAAQDRVLPKPVPQATLASALAPPASSRLAQTSSELLEPQPSRQAAQPASVAPRSGKLLIEEVEETVDLPGKEEEEEKAEKAVEEFDDESAEDGPGLSTQQVQSMLSVLCEETEIAEMDLKMGSFELRVRRSAKGSAASSPASSPAAAAAPAEAAPAPVAESMSSGQSMDEEDFLESLVPIPAPKVGILRRGRYVKGKKVGKGALASVGDKVKKGQTLAFIEQLGTFIPVESPLAGEVVEFVVDEGAPVEYNQVLVELAPFFGGHIIGDSKYA